MIRNRIKELVQVKASELIPNEKNWRTHSARQKSALQGLLADIGIASAVIVRKTPKGYQLIDGHMRKDVLGDTAVPALVVDLNDAEADMLLATLDPLAEMAGRNSKLLSELLASIKTSQAGVQSMLEGMGKSIARLGRTNPDDAPEKPKKTSVKLGQCFKLGDHVLLCGDSTKDVAALLGKDKPNLMVTDPPYGVNYDPTWRNAVGAGIKRAGEVKNDDRADWTEVWRGFPGAVAYVWHSALHASIVEKSLRDSDFAIRGQIIWKKQMAPMSRGHYHWQHEPCWYAVRNGKQANWVGDRKQTTVWDAYANIGPASSLDPGDTSTGHSTQKPVELFRRPMINHTAPDDSVFEPFAGSGSCLIAGEQTGRRVFAIELDPLYVDQAIQRWEGFSGRKAVRR